MERERNVQRIDGEVVHLHSLTVDELEAYRSYALERVHRAHTDVEVIEAELSHRSKYYLELNILGVELVNLPTRTQT